MTDDARTRMDIGLALLEEQTALLLAGVEGLDDVTAPSGLPGWTRGHVLAHLAGNAEGLARRARSVGDGVPRAMYESMETREADIQWRAGRTANDHRDALAATDRDLRLDLLSIPADRHSEQTELRKGITLTVEDLPLVRLQEVCIHHADLALPSYGWSEWPGELVAWALPRVASSFAARDEFPVAWVEVDLGGGAPQRFELTGPAGTGVSGSGAAVLAWLTGRSAGDGLLVTGVDAVPAAPAWL